MKHSDYEVTVKWPLDKLPDCNVGQTCQIQSVNRETGEVKVNWYTYQEWPAVQAELMRLGITSEYK